MSSRGSPHSRWKFAVTKSTNQAHTPPTVGARTSPVGVFVPNALS